MSSIFNGGITDLSTAIEQLNHVDGVMLGREAYRNPFILAQVDELFFGANPNCIDAMRQCVDVPVTVKCRIGIDNQDSEAALQNFVGVVAGAGCEWFVVNAR